MAPSTAKIIQNEAARRDGAVPIAIGGEVGFYSLHGALEGRGFEAEVSQELARGLTGTNTRGGVLVPPEVLFGAALDVATSTAGQELVFDRQPIAASPRRPTPRVARLGARIVDGPGQVQLLRITGGADLVWPGEAPGSPVSDSDPTTDGEDIVVHQGVVSTAYSRQLGLQNRQTAEIVERELRAVAAAAVDYAAIDGQGSGSNEPAGLLQRSADVNVVAIGTDGGAPTYATMTLMEEAAAADNVDELATGFLTTPQVRRKLRQTEVASGSGMVWNGSRVLGHRADVSTLVPSNLTKGAGSNLHAVIYSADWGNLVIHLLAVELLTDPYRLKKQRVEEVTIFLHVGVGLLHPEAFSIVVDANPAA